jgi:hypothetical protein
MFADKSRGSKRRPFALGPSFRESRVGSKPDRLLVVQIKCLTRLAMLQKGGFLPSRGALGNGRNRRQADIADRDGGRRIWAGSALTEVAAGRIVVRANAVLRLRARSRLHRISEPPTAGVEPTAVRALLICAFSRLPTVK